MLVSMLKEGCYWEIVPVSKADPCFRNCHVLPQSSKTAVPYAGYLDTQLPVMETLGYCHVSWLYHRCLFIVYLSLFTYPKYFRRLCLPPEQSLQLRLGWIPSCFKSSVLLDYDWEMAKIPGVFCIMAPRNHSRLLGPVPLAWPTEEESLKFLQFRKRRKG